MLSYMCVVEIYNKHSSKQLWETLVNCSTKVITAERMLWNTHFTGIYNIYIYMIYISSIFVWPFEAMRHGPTSSSLGRSGGALQRAAHHLDPSRRGGPQGPRSPWALEVVVGGESGLFCLENHRKTIGIWWFIGIYIDISSGWWFSWNMNMLFHILGMEFHHPNWRTHIFQMGSSTAHQIRYSLLMVNGNDGPIY